MKASTCFHWDTWSQPPYHLELQLSHRTAEALTALFRKCELTDIHDWLVSLSLTQESVMPSLPPMAIFALLDSWPQLAMAWLGLVLEINAFLLHHSPSWHLRHVLLSFSYFITPYKEWLSFTVVDVYSRREQDLFSQYAMLQSRASFICL